MASDKSFVQLALDQLKSVSVTCKPMFGEYALYKGNKVVALICDSQLFVKQRKRGKSLRDRSPKHRPTLARSRVYWQRRVLKIQNGFVS